MREIGGGGEGVMVLIVLSVEAIMGREPDGQRRTELQLLQGSCLLCSHVPQEVKQTKETTEITVESGVKK